MLHLIIYGRFRLVDGQDREIAIKSKKARALLSVLALSPGMERSREQLMALLWSDRGDDQARGSLRQALSGLRRDLGDAGVAALSITDEAVSLRLFLPTLEAPVLAVAEVRYVGALALGTQVGLELVADRREQTRLQRVLAPWIMERQRALARLGLARVV